MNLVEKSPSGNLSRQIFVQSIVVLDALDDLMSRPLHPGNGKFSRPRVDDKLGDNRVVIRGQCIRIRAFDERWSAGM